MTLAAAIAVAPLSAAAQTDDDRAGARVAATEGLKAFQDKRWAEAIDLFGRAESLVHAPPHLLYLARSYAQTGQLVKAQETYRKLVNETIPASAPKAFAAAQESARTEMPALEPRIPTLRVVVNGANGKPVTVTVDGVKLSAALVGLPKPTDPGAHKVRAFAEGLASDEQSVTLAEGAKETMTLELKPSSEAPPVAAAAEPPAAAGSAAPAAAPPGDTAPPPAGDQGPTESPASGGGLRTASYVALGVGVVGLGLGVVFTLKSSGNRKDAESLCGGDGIHCPTAKQDEIASLDDQAASAKTLATIGFIAGGVGLAAGVTMFLLSSPKKTAATHHPRVQPWVGLGSAGVFGSF